eukprot:1140989-Pelagomonas_calceolata.AAC.10
MSDSERCGGEYTELSSRSNLLTLDLSSAPFTGAQSGSVELQVPPDAASQLHAVVVWVDYELQDAGQQQGAAEGGTGMGPQPSAAATAVEGGAGCSNVVDNGPCSIAYSATQTVLLLPQQQQQQQQQACLYGVKVSACLEEDGMKLSADLSCIEQSPPFKLVQARKGKDTMQAVVSNGALSEEKSRKLSYLLKSLMSAPSMAACMEGRILYGQAGPKRCKTTRKSLREVNGNVGWAWAFSQFDLRGGVVIRSCTSMAPFLDGCGEFLLPA